MEQDQINMKLIGAVALGAIGGILLGRYLWSEDSGKQTLSTHLSTLSDVLKQIEGIETEEADTLKMRINNILDTIETRYVKTEK